MINSLLYIGAGTHLDIFKHFPYVEKFVLVDTLPRGYSNFNDSINKFDHECYVKNFIGNLITQMCKNNFMLTSIRQIDKKYYKKIFNTKQKIYYKLFAHKIPEFINPSLLIFNNIKSNQMVKYYISTSIQYNLTNELEQDIKETDGLIVCGHHPDKTLLDILDRPIKFYGYSSTCFSYEPEYLDNTIIEWLYENPNSIYKYFNEFYTVNYDGGKITQVENIIELNNTVCSIRYKNYNSDTDSNYNSE
jgi:hypothetical protein